jgi:hypothetical protein
MLKLIKRRRLTSVIQVINHQISSLNLFVSFLKSEKYIPSKCKTALDDIWAYLCILRAITAV